LKKSFQPDHLPVEGNPRKKEPLAIRKIKWRRKGMQKKIKLYSVLILVGIIMIVVLQNTQAVETRLLFFSVIMPIAALLGITLMIGIFIGCVGALIIFDRTEQKKE
jgi:uncharacterized integral membrane protein